MISTKVITSRKVTDPFNNVTYTNRESHYRITIQHILKGDAILKYVQKLNYYADSSWDTDVYTGASGGMCGVSLIYGEVYLLTGKVWKGKPRIGTCGLNARYSDERIRGIVKNGYYNCYFWIIILGFILVVLSVIIVVLVTCRNKCGASPVPAADITSNCTGDFELRQTVDT